MRGGLGVSIGDFGYPPYIAVYLCIIISLPRSGASSGSSWWIPLVGYLFLIFHSSIILLSRFPLAMLHDLHRLCQLVRSQKSPQTGKGITWSVTSAGRASPLRLHSSQTGWDCFQARLSRFHRWEWYRSEEGFLFSIRGPLPFGFGFHPYNLSRLPAFHGITLNILTLFILHYPVTSQGVTFKFNIIIRWLYLGLCVFININPGGG